MENFQRTISELESIPGTILGYTTPINWGAPPSVKRAVPPSISLPRLETETAAAVVPLMHAYLAHEAGHLKFTDPEVLSAYQYWKGVQVLFNTIEDGRVNRLVARAFPDMKTDIAFAYTCFPEYHPDCISPYDPDYISPIYSAVVCLLFLAGGRSRTEASERIGCDPRIVRALLRSVEDVTSLFPHMSGALDALAHAQVIFKRWSEETYRSPYGVRTAPWKADPFSSSGTSSWTRHMATAHLNAGLWGQNANGFGERLASAIVEASRRSQDSPELSTSTGR